MQLQPIKGKFDSEHLMNIHKYLFEDIYPFAGSFRTCTMAKTTRNFYDPDMIRDELEKELKELNDSFKIIGNNYKNMTFADDSFLYSYATVLANAYYQIMTIHPFREGNGRSTREFLREFVVYNNINLSFDLELDFSKMDKENALKGVEYKFIYPSMLMMEFKKALVSMVKEKTK